MTGWCVVTWCWSSLHVLDCFVPVGLMVEQIPEATLFCFFFHSLIYLMLRNVPVVTYVIAYPTPQRLPSQAESLSTRVMVKGKAVFLLWGTQAPSVNLPCQGRKLHTFIIGWENMRHQAYSLWVCINHPAFRNDLFSCHSDHKPTHHPRLSLEAAAQPTDILAGLWHCQVIRNVSVYVSANAQAHRRLYLHKEITAPITILKDSLTIIHIKCAPSTDCIEVSHFIFICHSKKKKN